jgi:hypothetical protein
VGPPPALGDLTVGRGTLQMNRERQVDELGGQSGRASQRGSLLSGAGRGSHWEKPVPERPRCSAVTRWV